jgi:hypothetical protein
MKPFVMIDSVAAVLGLASAGIFLAHAIESYRAHAYLFYRDQVSSPFDTAWANS